MEMTQSPNMLPFLMLTLVLSKQVGSAAGECGKQGRRGLGVQALHPLPHLTSLLPWPAHQVGDHFNYSVFDHQMMLKGLAFVGIDEGKAKKSKFQVG